jgi:hypothetical protein
VLFNFEERPSDSPFIEAIWRTQSERAGVFSSVAASQGELVLSKHKGQITFTVRGPETKATPAHCEWVDAEFLGIVFKLGTFFPHLPPGKVMNRNDVHLPQATSKTFWLYGSTWQFPDYENADTFVDRLVREGLLVHDSIVDATRQGQVQDLSLRSIQRRFLRATGLTYGGVCQIERARYALTLLQQGVSILDTVELAGYADQPHLTRSLKHFVGQTPAQIIDQAMATSRI